MFNPNTLGLSSSSFPSSAQIVYPDFHPNGTKSSPGKSEAVALGREDIESSLEAMIAFHSPDKKGGTDPSHQQQQVAQGHKQAPMPTTAPTAAAATSGWAAIAASSHAKSSGLSSSPPTAVEAAIAWKQQQQQLSHLAQASIGGVKAIDHGSRIASRVSPRVQVSFMNQSSSSILLIMMLSPLIRLRSIASVLQCLASVSTTLTTGSSCSSTTSGLRKRHWQLSEPSLEAT